MAMGARGKVHGSGEEGSALIIVLMMIAMLGVLTLTVATLSVNNLAGARRAQQAGVALNAADAGLAQAVAYLRNTGVRGLACSPLCDGVDGRQSNQWGNRASPTTVTVPGGTGASYKVWIEPILAYPAHNPAKYQVHSLGVTGAPAGRAVTQDVWVKPQKFPLGIFGKSIQGGGGGVYNQSIFSTGCVSKRSQIDFGGADILNNYIQPSVHTSDIITDANTGCAKKAQDNIHADGYCSSNPKYRYDQDSLGGPLADTSPCKGADGQTSLIANDQELFAKFNLSSPPLTDAQLDRLKTVAISQGNYWEDADYTMDSDVWTSPEPNVVMYFDLLKTPSVQEVNLNSILLFDRAARLSATSSACTPRSLVIIVNGGNVGMNSNQNLAASLFVLGDIRGGNVSKFNGNSQYIGTLYASNIDLKGGANVEMDECFKASLSPALFDVETSNYREVDR